MIPRIKWSELIGTPASGFKNHESVEITDDQDVTIGFLIVPQTDYLRETARFNIELSNSVIPHDAVSVAPSGKKSKGKKVAANAPL